MVKEEKKVLFYIYPDSLYYVRAGVPKVLSAGQVVPDEDVEYILREYPDRVAIKGGYLDVQGSSESVSDYFREFKDYLEGYAKRLETIFNSISKVAVVRSTSIDSSASCSIDRGYQVSEVEREDDLVRNLILDKLVDSSGITSSGNAGESVQVGKSVASKVAALKSRRDKSS